jgi:hypothetical protein
MPCWTIKKGRKHRAVKRTCGQILALQERRSLARFTRVERGGEGWQGEAWTGTAQPVSTGFLAFSHPAIPAGMT